MSIFFHERSKRTAHDIAWQPSRKRNPYALALPQKKIKKRLALVTIFLCFFLMAGLFFFHPFFSVSDIIVSGTERLKTNEIRDAVIATMNRGSRIIPAQNYFFVNTSEVQQILAERFPLSEVVVQKQFPHTMSVSLKEKLSTIIYDDGKEYSYLGRDGQIVEVLRAVGDDEWEKEIKLVTSTSETGEEVVAEEIISAVHLIRPARIRKELGNYPIVYRKEMRGGHTNDQVIHEEMAKNIVNWYQRISLLDHMTFGYIELTNELGDAVIFLEQGWYIKMNLYDDVDRQYQALYTTLTKQLKGKPIEYVDVRFSGKVYWQTKS